MAGRPRRQRSSSSWGAAASSRASRPLSRAGGRRGGHPPGRWRAVRRRLRHQRARPTAARLLRARPGRRVRQGRGRRHPRAAAVRRAGRPARLAAAGGLPARRQRLPRPAGLGRGLRHRGPPGGGPARARTRSQSAGHPPVAHFDAGSGPWSLPAAGGPRSASCRRRAPRRPGSLAAATPSCSTPTGWSRARHATSKVGIDQLLGEAERLVPRGDSDGAAQLLRMVAGPPVTTTAAWSSCGERAEQLPSSRSAAARRPVGSRRLPVAQRVHRRDVLVPRHEHLAQRPRRWSVSCWVSSTASPPSRSRRHRSTSATLDAPVSRWNIDSPLNTAPVRTP